MNSLDLLLVRKVDDKADNGDGVARANHLPGQSVATRAVIDARGVLILIDDLHPHETLGAIGQRNRHRSSIEVKNRKRVQRCAAGTNNTLLDGSRKLAAMAEFSETAVLDHPGEIHIGLGAIVVFDRDGLRWR